MFKKSLLLLVITIISLSYFNAFAETLFYPSNTLDIKLFGSKASSSSYFDLEGKIITEEKDKSVSTDQNERKILFNYEDYTLGIKGEYSLTDNLVISLSFPLKYYSLSRRSDSTYILYDSSYTPPQPYTYSQKFNLGDNSLFQPAYYSIAARYKFYSKKSYSALLFEFRVPPGFHKGIQNDPNYPFLSDGAFETLIGAVIGVKFEKSWLETSFKYNFRGEDLVDYYLIHTEGGITTVKDSKILFFFNFLQSAGSFKNAVKFDPLKTTLQSNSFNAGFLFELFLTENLYTQFSYNLNLLGKNTLNIGWLTITAGYRI